MSESLRVRRTFSILLGTGVGVQIILFLGMLVLARLYSPDAFGEYGFYAGMAATIAIVAGGRVDYLAFLKGTNDYGKNDFYFSSLVVCLAICCFVFIGAWAAKGWWAERILFEWWILFFVFSYSIFYLGTQNLLAQGDYKFFSKIRFYQVIIQVSVGLCAFSLWPYYGLSISFVGVQLVLGVILLFRILNNNRFPRPSKIILVYKKFYSKALVNSLISILQYSAPFAPVFFGSIHYSQGEVGAYFLFAQVAAAPLSIFRRSLLNFLNAEFYSVEKLTIILKEYSRVGGYFILFFLLLFFVGGGVLAFWSEYIVGLLFGKQWLMYVGLLLPLVMYYVIDSCLQPITTLLPLWGVSRISLLFEIFRFLLIYFGGGFVVFFMDVSFYHFVMCFILSMVFVYFMQALYIIFYLRRQSCV